MREIHIMGPRTHVQVVRASTADSRTWLAGSPICGALEDYYIVHCGIMHARAPLEIARTNLSGTFFFACFEGEGYVLIDGEWRTVRAGQACIQPPFIPNALKAISETFWKFCWVRYQEAPERRPLVSLHSPALGTFNSLPLRLAIEGLHAEASHDAASVTMMKWLELIHGYVLSFANPAGFDERIARVWVEVEQRLEENWTLDQMAEIGCVSKEHLRRLCKNSLGRSPMQHVAFLRMQQAAFLLRTTDYTITRIAQRLGYSSQFAFSDAFQRWFNCRPSAYRDQNK